MIQWSFLKNAQGNLTLAEASFSWRGALPFVNRMIPETRIFRCSMITSGLLHGLVFASLFYGQFYYVKNTPKITEIVYQKKIQDPAQVQVPRQEIKPLKEEPSAPPPKIFTPQDMSSVPMKLSQNPKAPVQFSKQKKLPAPLSSLDSKRQIFVPVLSSEKISNPNYMNYQQHIRNKIKSQANIFKDDPRFQSGEVYLTFVLGADGQLKDIRIIDQKTRASEFLRRVSLRSIKEASPFPPFPFELKYPELPFNVSISFVMD
ncbi:MAG TPA: hypothetical protein PLT76_02125 [Candidatus Omnitrophota bacterium]|mgnify:CR=1 FL=1|nr:hypothetical protein [Candidatus Omnitrophota bacterium]